MYCTAKEYIIWQDCRIQKRFVGFNFLHQLQTIKIGHFFVANTQWEQVYFEFLHHCDFTRFFLHFQLPIEWKIRKCFGKLRAFKNLNAIFGDFIKIWLDCESLGGKKGVENALICVRSERAHSAVKAFRLLF